MPKLLLIFLAVIILSGLIFVVRFFFDASYPNSSSPQQKNAMHLDGHAVLVEIADTPQEQVQGLSGRQELEDGTGMLFPYSPPQEVTFWMKDMLIPIDMVFIKDSRVVTLYEKVQPEPGVPLSGIKRYPSMVPIDYVLEVPAGWSSKNEVSVGSTAIYTP